MFVGWVLGILTAWTVWSVWQMTLPLRTSDWWKYRKEIRQLRREMPTFEKEVNPWQAK